MSKDVATLIWELAKFDKELEGLELKKMFEKKISLDSTEIANKLKQIVSNKIKTSIQPLYSEVRLSNNKENDNFIEGSLAHAF